MKKVEIIFIGGCERSGTTMLASYLGSTSNTVVTPESHFIIDLFHKFGLNITDSKAELYDCLVCNHRFKLWEVSDHDTKKIINSSSSLDEVMFKLVLKYADNNYVTEPILWIDHTPSNLEVSSSLERIFSDAKFINIVRDGRAVYSSVKDLDWGPTSPELGALWWRHKVTSNLLNSLRLDGKVIVTKFETLLTNPKEELIRICKCLNVGFDESMLNGQGFNVPNYTKQQHSLVGGEVNQQRANSWKKKLSSREIETFNNYASLLLEYYGYSGSNHSKIDARKFNPYTLPVKPVILDKIRSKFNVIKRILRRNNAQ